ncbi:GGDEF domain-containing protein [Catenuloplanes japonicus]|uniref:GGDEF domain-containing protein n=1 Tax=Catenuloplanes japonicus TaxID=33876 RepID=UPI000B122A32|nr:GGDEF domain-containing protein [Catenuloplanes japonicus]
MDVTLTLACLLAAGTAGLAWRSHRRARRAEAEAAGLRLALDAERHTALHDPLTGLPNRRAFYRLGAERVAVHDKLGIVAAVVDLDDFKRINDEYGHAAGDTVLSTVARRLADYAGDDLVARLGGDEFAALLTGAAIDVANGSHATRISTVLSSPIPLGGTVSDLSVTVTASVGLVPVTPGMSLAEALGRADTEMYVAKSLRCREPQAAPAPRPPVTPMKPVIPRQPTELARSKAGGS